MSDAIESYGTACRKREALGHLSSTTVRNYWDDLTDFARLVGFDTVVDDLTGEDVDDAFVAYANLPDRRFTDERAARVVKRSVSTQNRFRRSVSQFFHHAETHGWVQMSPMAFVSGPAHAKDNSALIRSERRSLHPPQAEALLKYGAGDPSAQVSLRAHERNYERDAYLLALMLVLGPRVSEIAGANRDDIVDTGSGTVWHIVGKGKKRRTLPFSPELLRLRTEYAAKRPTPHQSLSPFARDDALRAEFLTGRGARMTARDVQRMVQRAHQRVRAVDASLSRGVTPHALRHTAATLLLSSGWDVKVVRDLLGHSSIATTSLYLDEVNDEMAAAVRDHPLLRGVPRPTDDEVALGA